MTVAGRLCAWFDSVSEPSASAEELAWYCARLPRAAGTILDLMCGYGRLLVPLAETGYALHGVDESAAMIAECESRLSRVSVKTTPMLFRQDVAELNAPFRYAAAFIGHGAFQRMIDIDRARSALARIRAHLVDPGLLLLDLYVPAESAQRIAAPLVEVRSTSLPDGSRIALRSETTMFPDARLARTHSRYVHRRGHDLLGEESETLARTWYAPDDIVALAEAAGFRGVAVDAGAHAVAEARAYSIRAYA